MKIQFDQGKNAPELAICWYVGQMLATEKFINAFIKSYLGKNIDIKELRICREPYYGNKRLDLCLYITDVEEKLFGIVIEAKVHWPDENQLLKSVKVFKENHPNFEEVFGIHFISTIEHKQIDGVSGLKSEFKIVGIKHFLELYCSNGIKTGHSLRWASDLHQLLNYEHS